MSVAALKHPEPTSGLQPVCPTYPINAHWDAESNVWIATSDDIQGLILECESYDGLLRETLLAVPELLSCEGVQCGDFQLDVVIKPIESLVADG